MENIMNIKKLHYCLLPLATLLSGCFDDTEIEADTQQYITYDLKALHYPNDLYLTGSDGTIELASEASEETDYHNYENVYGALDGWSTGYKIRLPLAGVDTEIDEGTLAGNVVVYDVAAGALLGEDKYISRISAEHEIEILPTEVLPESTSYILAVTAGVKDIDGVSLRKDYNYDQLSRGEALDDANSNNAISQIAQNESLLKQAGVSDEIVYSAAFTTQSIMPVMEAGRALIPDDIALNDDFGDLTEISVGSQFSKYDTYGTTVTLPYYLELPTSVADCKVLTLSNTQLTEDEKLAVRADPIGSCPALYSWWEDSTAGFIHGANTALTKKSDQTVPVVIYAPKDWDGRALPAAIFVHGITGWKESAATMVASITDTERLVIVIDQPLHGSSKTGGGRGVDLDGDGILDITATSTEEFENKSVYLNLTSPLTLRDNQRQAVLDQLALRKALNNTNFVDKTDVSLIGLSLGGIVSTMVSEMSQNDPAFTFTTVNLAVPGMHLTDLMMNSKLLSGEVVTEIKASTDVQLAVAGLLGLYDDTVDSPADGLRAIDTYRAESTENEEKTVRFEQIVYDMVEADLLQATQASVDGGDPANFTVRQATNTAQPILLLEAVGDCSVNGVEGCQAGEYMPDTIIPNGAEGLPLAGTEPLIRHLGLAPITGAIPAGADIIKGVIRVTTGGHGTYLFPYEGTMDEESGLPGVPEGDELKFLMNSMEMQQIAVASFIESAGQGVDIAPELLPHVKDSGANITQ
jgi:pimeloyl-ACP methyl ester carboxylesterase